MSLLLLFSDQIAAAASGDVVTTMLIETTTGVWYTATADLISGTVTRGKQNELDQYQAGTADVLLNNDTRTYDPTYAASPLNGYILPMKRVQLRDTYAGITYPLFAGYADRWTQNREGPHRGTTTLSATDGFKVLERATLASSAYAQEVVNDGPIAWYRLNEPEGSTTIFDSSSNDYDLGVNGAPGFGEPSLIARDPDTAVTIATTADGADRVGGVISNGPFSVEMVFRRSSLTGSLFLVGQAAADVGPGWALQDRPDTNNFRFLVIPAVGSNHYVDSTTITANATTYHVVGVWEASGALKIYVNGVDVTDVADSVATGPAFTGQTFAIAGGQFGNDTATGVLGTYDDVAIYDTALSAARVAAHAAAVSTPWNGDLPGTRIGRVLDAVDWPTDQRNIDAGTTPLQSAELGMSALSHAQTVSDTEFGDLYVTAGGVMRFEARSAGVDQPVVATFSDAPGGDLPITFSAAEISDENIRNDVTISRLEGVAQNAQDPTSIAAFLRFSYTRDGLYHDDDDYSRYLAQFILAGYKDPVERVSQMTVNPYRDPANLWPAILGLELTDRVILNETPQNVAPEVSRTLVVEGISHSFSAKSWSASFNLSENTAATQAYWQLGVTNYSELGQTTRLFF